MFTQYYRFTEKMIQSISRGYKVTSFYVTSKILEIMTLYANNKLCQLSDIDTNVTKKVW